MFISKQELLEYDRRLNIAESKLADLTCVVEGLKRRLREYEEQKKARADAPDYTGIIDEWLNGDKEGRKE